MLKGTVAGQPFEQHYPIKLAVSSAPGNGFVPRLWASLMTEELERGGKGEDRAKIVALSQGYGVMSRETSLLVLESAAMFDAFGVDRTVPAAKWTGEDALDEVATGGTIQVGGEADAADRTASGVATKADDDEAKDKKMPAAMPAAKAERAHTTSVGMSRPDFGPGGGTGMGMGLDRNGYVAMHRVWTRVAAISAYDGVSPSITTEIAKYEDALAKSPDSREKHRALVQALSYAGELDQAREVANRWLDRDRLDPQALGYIADLAGRNGERDRSLRILAGLVDLDADRITLHERMVNAYERTGRLAQACGHRIAIASLEAKNPAAAGSAARCLRTPRPRQRRGPRDARAPR